MSVEKTFYLIIVNVNFFGKKKKKKKKKRDNFLWRTIKEPKS